MSNCGYPSCMQGGGCDREQQCIEEDNKEMSGQLNTEETRLATHMRITERQLKASTLEIERLEAFKTYVHKRLDKMDVPHDPEPKSNAEHGCRIEGRLNYIENANKTLRSYVLGEPCDCEMVTRYECNRCQTLREADTGKS